MAKYTATLRIEGLDESELTAFAEHVGVFIRNLPSVHKTELSRSSYDPVMPEPIVRNN